MASPASLQSLIVVPAHAYQIQNTGGATPSFDLTRNGQRLASDVEDLQVMRIRPDEVVFVTNYLNSLDGKGTKRAQADEAFVLLESLEVHEHE